MKKIIFIIACLLVSIAAFSQSGSQAVSGIKYRVNDTTAYQAAVATAHSQGYADIYWNNQATTPHWDIWNGSSYDHVFDFNAGGTGGGTTTNAITFNNGGSGAASGTTFDGSVARTISYNTIGAQPTISFGTGVLTALGVNIGSAGAPVLFNDALGTPSSGTATNLTGLPISTGVSGLGSNVATMLATFSSANIAAAATDETGSGSLVFGTSPTIATPNITTGLTIGGSASSGTILRGNGTNYVSSTATYPNTVSTGQILYGSASNVVSGLALGTANQILGVNSGATNIEWKSSTTGAAVTVTSGSNLHFTTGGNISTGAVNSFSIGGNLLVSTSVTTTTTLSGSYEVVHATSSGGSYTITLPPLATYPDKIYIIIKETAANTITIDGDGSETVVGSTTFAMTDLNQTLFIQAQAGGWMPINLNYSGTYTPTLTNSANLAASTARLCTFNRVGNSVTVSGQVDIDPTTTATLTTLGISLPVASNFTTAFQAGGTGAAIGVADAAAGIQSDATNDRATFQYVCTDVTNHTMTFTFTYQVL